MKAFVLAAALASCSMASSASAAPPDVSALGRAAAAMGDCSKIVDELAGLKVPQGLARTRAAEYLNKQVGDGPEDRLVEIDPSHEPFLKQMQGAAGRLEECGKTYRTARQESEGLLEKLGKTELGEKDAAALSDPIAQYHAAIRKLAKSLSGLGDNVGVQGSVSKILQEYFLKDLSKQGSAKAEAAAAAESTQAGFQKELKDIQKKQKEALQKAQEVMKEALAKARQALKEQEERVKAEAAKPAAAKLAPAKPSPDPLSPEDTRAAVAWIAKQVSSERQPYCNRDSYGRGAGVPGSSCWSQEKDGSLCYPQCSKSGFYGVGPVCWQSCPSGYLDMGPTCHIDKPLTTDVRVMVCKAYIMKYCYGFDWVCPSGYSGNGTTCVLDPPPVPAGFSGTGLDLIKDSYSRGAGSPMMCSSSQQYEAGLCYTPCKTGDSGVGPVCWMGCPSGKVDCGTACANSRASCATKKDNTLISPLMMAFKIAAMGSSSSMDASYKTILEGAKIFKNGASVGIRLRGAIGLWLNDGIAGFDQMTSPRIRTMLDEACKGHRAAEEHIQKQYLLQNLNIMLEKDLKQSAESTLAAASDFDPSGASGVMSVYLNPRCVVADPFPKVTFQD